jgi:LysR family hydrogen peroxide-inducible transcriptional activator
MNVSTLSLRDLEYVVAVAEHEHFGKAAHAVHVSQPALSSQIKKVEDILGVAIFERTKRSVAITTVGKSLVQQARVILDEARKFHELARATIQPLEGPFHLGVIASVGPYYVPYLLRSAREKFPRLSLHLREGLTDGLLEQLKAGELDAVVASPTFDPAGFAMFGLYFEPFLLAAPSDSDLARRKEPPRANDLEASKMVLLEDGHCLRDQTLDFCPSSRRGGSLSTLHATSLETLKHLVASGLGYTLIPKLAAPAKSGNPLGEMIRYRGFSDPRVGREIILLTRKSSARLAEVELLAKQLQKQRPPGTQTVARA